LLAQDEYLNAARIPSNNRNVWIWAMAGMLLLAFLLRIWSIDKESFWADEGWTMLLAKGPTLADVVQTMAADQHPPLYFALFHYWIALVGNSESMARMLSAFWSLFGVAVAYQVGREVFRSRGAGLLAALLLALSDHDILFAQETRHYAQMAALALLSGLFYLRYLRRPTRWNGIGWLLAGVALLYTHYLGAFVLLVQGLHILIAVRPLRRWPDLIFRLGLISVAWLPWAFIFIRQSQIRYTRPILFQNSLPNTPETFIGLRSDLFGAGWGLTFGLMLLGGVTLICVRGKPRIEWRALRNGAYLYLWAGLPAALLVIINTRFQILTTRNLLLVTPAIAILIGHGLMNLERNARVFLVVIIVVIGLLTTDAYFVKPPWRVVAADVLRYRLADEPILMDVWVDDFALRYHLGRDLNVDPATLPLVSKPEWSERYSDQFSARLLDYVNRVDSLWLVQWSKDEGGIIPLLEGHGFRRTASQLETHLTTNLIHIWRYDRLLGGEPRALFDSRLALAKVSYPAEVTRGVAFPVALWWDVRADLTLDYSTSVFLLDSAGALVAQHDGPPLDGLERMSGWRAGELRFDEPRIMIPTALPAGTYTLGLKVYFYADPQPLPFAPNPEAAGFLALGRVTVR